MSPKSSPKPVQDLSFEEAYTELQTLVEALENDQRPLEEAIALFERGQALIARCAALLDAADLRVQQLTGNGLSDFSGE
ncbi:MAG: exodeoxyribonuclease VII small subunit [Anaerolineales bacterium]